MKTTGVSSIPKFGLLDFLGHPIGYGKYDFEEGNNYGNRRNTNVDIRSGFHVFGHSWGTIVATLYAAKQPTGLRKKYKDKDTVWT